MNFIKTSLTPSLHWIFVFTIVNLPEVVVFDQVFPIPRLFSIFFFITTTIQLYLSNQNIVFNKILKPLLSLWIVFLFYIFIIDLHHSDLSNAIKQLLKNLCFLLTFIAFLNLRNRSDQYSKRYLFISFTFIFSIAIFLGYIQMILPSFTFHNLLDFRPIVYQPVADEKLIYYYIQEGRLTGPYNIAIGYSLLIGFIAIYYVSFLLYTDRYKKLCCLLLTLTIFLSYFTHTRSLTFGLIPSILISKAILERKTRSLIICLMIFIIFLSLNIFLILPTIKSVNKRASMVFDSNTTLKTVATIYGSIGALYLSPVIGIPHEDNLKAIKTGAEITSLRIFPTQSLIDTNHNQFAYYLKYYGLLGFSLFILLNMHLIKILFKFFKRDKHLGFIVFTNYIYLMQFSLFHNNFLFSDFVFWSTTGLFINFSSHKLRSPFSNNLIGHCTQTAYHR